VIVRGDRSRRCAGRDTRPPLDLGTNLTAFGLGSDREADRGDSRVVGGKNVRAELEQLLTRRSITLDGGVVQCRRTKLLAYVHVTTECGQLIDHGQVSRARGKVHWSAPIVVETVDVSSRLNEDPTAYRHAVPSGCIIEASSSAPSSRCFTRLVAKWSGEGAKGRSAAESSAEMDTDRSGEACSHCASRRRGSGSQLHQPLQ